ncbi:GmrSD restriction endonuclease domain-containing protein [Acinetobacter towneri]|uniref:GmrSD restriction endonuclease domain-containing protein n=1 Tax=Acinetobacter towneri TaxID=202956 RepID=UPI003A880AE4
MTTTSSKDLRLTGIIEEIYSGDYQLPEFQRDYVWKDSNVKSLFESVLLGHPIGSLLILELNKEDPIFAWTNFNGIYPEDNRKLEYEGENKLPPSFLVLDGQQRLTSLSKLTDTNSEKIWFLDLIKLKDSWINFGSPTEDENIKKWIETDVDIVSALSRKKKTDDPEKELRGKKKLMPLKILKNKTLFSNSINEIRDSITEKNAEIKYEIKNYKSLGIKASKDELEKLIDENEIWLKFLSAPLMRLFDNYYDYNMPCVIVSEKMGISGVCKVFTKINTSGIALGAFDLLVAVMYPKKIPIKQKFEDAMESFPLVKILDEDAKRYLLQTIALFEGLSPKTAGLPEVLKPEHIDKSWNTACSSLQIACEELDVYCGSALSKGSDRFLVYSPLVASAAVVLHKFPIRILDSNIKLLRQQKLQAWYFGSGVRDRYSDGTDAKQNQDIKEMSAWFASPSFDADMPKWLEELFADFNNVSKNSSLGKAILSMINLKRPKDFYSINDVGPYAIEPCDLHHIFPRAALRDKVMSERNLQDKNVADRILKNEYQVDSVFNQTWILSETNRNIISDDLPSVYLNKIITQYGGGDTGKNKLIDVMRDHIINKAGLEALLMDDYFKFIEERKKMMKNEFKTTGFLRNLIDQETVDD